MKKDDDETQSQHGNDTPRCLENMLLGVEKGPWGLHAKAKRRIAEGTVITRNASLAHKYKYLYLHCTQHSDSNNTSTNTGDCCASCSVTPSEASSLHAKTRLFRCSACQVVKYCGRDCQRLDFVQHKRECQYLQKIYDKRDINRREHQHEGEVEEVCLLLRTFGELEKLRRQAAQKCGSACYCKAGLMDGNGIATISCGTHHWNTMVRADLSDTMEEQSARYKTRILETVANYTTWTAKETRDTMQVFQANNFAIVNTLHETIGEGIFPHAALLNHSCDPNCLLRFNSHSKKSKKTVLEIVALRNIDEGEELTHSYVDLVENTETRQRRLHDTHGFICKCQRCEGRVTVQLPRSAPPNLYEWIINHLNPGPAPVATENASSKAIQGATSELELVFIPVDEALRCYGGPSTPCCPKEFASGEQILDRFLLESRRHFAADNIAGELSALQKALKTMLETSPVPPPLSRDLYQLRAALLSALLVALSSASPGNEDDGHQTTLALGEASEACNAMVAFLLVALPANHPLLGLQLFTLGDLTGDRSFHKWARRVLRISHGSSHDLVRRLDAIIYP